MNRAFVLCLAAVCCLTVGSAAHADQISYSFAEDYAPLFFNHNHLSGFALNKASGVLPASVLTSPATIGTNVLAFSLAPKTDPLQLFAAFRLTLQDKTSSGQTLSKTVPLGWLFGPVSSQSSNLHFYSLGKQTVTFGQHTYKITFASDKFQSTNLHSGGLFLTQGRLNFTVTDPPSGSTASATPEPSSFVLAGIGLPLFGLFLRRRRS